MLRTFLANNWMSFLLIFFALSVSWPLFIPGYFSHHDDLQVIRIFEMRRCFSDLQIPCRWAPDMGYGFGIPVFNFYSAVPYYLGALMSYLFGFVNAVKVMFFVAITIGVIGVYLLAQELYERKDAAFLSAVLYIFLPYRALDIYARGALAEAFGMAMFGFIFYFSLALYKRWRKSYFFGLVISLSILFLSHNIMSMLFLPFFLFSFAYYLAGRGIKGVLIYILALGFSLTISGFFLIPGFFEKELVQTDTLIIGDLDFRNHFVSLEQLFVEREWGYGASVFGDNDGLSFQLGIVHLIVGVIALVYFIYSFVKSPGKRHIEKGWFFVIFIISIFMTHSRSAFVWEQIDILHYTQFPWRFLSLAGFSLSVIGGLAIFVLRGKMFRTLFLLVVALSLVLLNFSYFKPNEFFINVNDETKLNGELWDEQKKGALLDYLPVGAREPSEAAAPLVGFMNYSDRWEYVVQDGDIEITVPVYDFAGWKVFSGGQEIEHYAGETGLIKFTLDGDFEKVEGRFMNTSIRKFSNLISVFAVFSFILFLINNDKRKKIIGF